MVLDRVNSRFCRSKLVKQDDTFIIGTGSNSLIFTDSKEARHYWKKILFYNFYLNGSTLTWAKKKAKTIADSILFDK